MKYIVSLWRRIWAENYVCSVSVVFFFVLLLMLSNIVSRHDAPPSLNIVCGEGTVLEKHTCWETNLKKIVDDYGAPAALDQLRNLFDDGDKGPSSYCHTLAHVVGTETYKQFALKGTFTYSSEMSNCSYGFYHGFIESMLAQMGDYSAVKNFCTNIVSGEDPGRLRAECFHGIGHGVVDRHVPEDWKYPKQILSRSFKVCTAMPDVENVDTVRNCVDGVYSGIRVVYFFGEYKVSLAPEHILDLCKDGPKEYLDICYNYMSTMFLKAATNDFAKGLRLATTYTDAAYQSVAVGAVAASWATANMFVEPQKTWSTCRLLPTGLRPSCIAGYARGLVQNSKPGNEYVPSLRFCSQEGVDAIEAESCFTATQGELQRKYSRADLNIFCKEYAPSQESLCAKILSQ